MARNGLCRLASVKCCDAYGDRREKPLERQDETDGEHLREDEAGVGRPDSGEVSLSERAMSRRIANEVDDVNQ